MKLSASDIVSRYRPDKCDLRVFLRHRGEAEAEDPFSEILKRIGLRHERDHLASLGPYLDISVEPFENRRAKTVEAIRSRIPVLYQPTFEITEKILGVDVDIVGAPDFLVLQPSGYQLRDSKMSRRIDEKHHPEIILQVQLYAWLFERTTGAPPIGIQVHAGTGDLVEVAYDGGLSVRAELERIIAIKQSKDEFYEPVGWSKCDRCGFRDRCWSRAEESGDVALVSGVDQNLARELHSLGTRTRSEFLGNFDSRTLSEFRRPWGSRMQRVGNIARRILLSAESMESGREIILQTPAVPSCANYVMFDLEGMPPSLDELEKIYMWGTRVYGASPGEFKAAVSGFGADGDREGWIAFLQIAQGIFEKYGDVPFVHWADYEKTNLDRYVGRHGDPQGVAARVNANLLDLLDVCKEAIILPLPSYSLKVIEDYVGFERKAEEYGGQWAMAMFIEATETSDEEKRRELMDKILQYNEEDLAATWAVFQWLRSKRAP